MPVSCVVVMACVALGPVHRAREAEVVAKIARAVDARVAHKWLVEGAVPAPRADDAEFCRRAYLDFVGRIPKVGEARAFAADKSPGKRAALVAALVARPSFDANLAAALRHAWLPETPADFRGKFLGDQYQEWLRERIARRTPLDAIARRTLTVPVLAGQRGQFRARDGAPHDDQAAESFYTAAQVKPETLGANVSRAFLGVKLECAQCHDHPFAPYLRDQFWQFAAFFAEFTPLPPTGPNFVGPHEPQSDKNRLTEPKSGKMVRAAYLDGESPEWAAGRTPREELAGWLTGAGSPYFARTTADRLWAHLFGYGLTDPLDEPGDKNPPSHPELLDDLTALVAEAGYDPRTILRGLAASRAYQLTGALTHPSQGEARRFARMPTKALTATQIHDSFVAATGLKPQPRRYYDDTESTRGTFALLFPTPVKPTQADSSILQALAMMNGRAVAEQTDIDKSTVLAAIIDAPFLDTAGKLETLFFTALARTPTAEEKDRLTSYVDRGGPSGDPKKALADVFWVLLNSPEFLFNH